jgi:hypothetical protein
MTLQEFLESKGIAAKGAVSPGNWTFGHEMAPPDGAFLEIQGYRYWISPQVESQFEPAFQNILDSAASHGLKVKV